KIERTFEEGTRPGTEKKEAAKPPKPTVEEESSESTAVTKAEDDSSKQVGQPTTKYWVSERTTGSFMRSFRFPADIDQEKVSAKLKDGLLTVVVPKKEKKAAKKIMVE